MKPEIIGIPHGTRLVRIVLVNGETHIWTALGYAQGDYSQWVGTYLRVEPNGRVSRVTRERFDTDVPDFVIKERDND